MALALNVFKTITHQGTTGEVGIYTAPVGYSGVVLLAQATNTDSTSPALLEYIFLASFAFILSIISFLYITSPSSSIVR